MIYKYLSYFIFKPLFGDRKKWGLKTDYLDKNFECIKSVKNLPMELNLSW